MAEQPTSAQFVEVATTGGVITAGIVGPTVREREAGIINEDVAASITSTGKALRYLVLDMTRVEFMPSIGVGMCVDLRNRAHSNGAKTAVVGLNRNLLQIFKLMKLDRLFTMVDDQEALAKVISR